MRHQSADGWHGARQVRNARRDLQVEVVKEAAEFILAPLSTKRHGAVNR